MHIEKNVFDNVFHTFMDNKERTKDNEKARMDLKEYCHWNDCNWMIMGNVLNRKQSSP